MCLQLSVMMRLSYYLSVFFNFFSYLVGCVCVCVIVGLLLVVVISLFCFVFCLSFNSFLLVTVAAVLLNVVPYNSLCSLPGHSEEIGTSQTNLSCPSIYISKTVKMSHIR